MDCAILELQNLSKYYVSGRNVVAGLDSIGLSFRLGEFVAVTGESGSGKSTLAHVLAGILPYEKGELLLEGKPTSHYDGADWELYRRDKIGFISQDYGILEGLTVLENITCVLRLLGIPAADAKQQAEDILHRVDLFELRGRSAGKLSSGQKQRLSIARALAKPVSILIADEPTGNLDKENSEKIIRLLADAAKERLVILITHDLEEVAPYATRRLTLADGKLITDTPLHEPNAVPEKHAVPRPPKKSFAAFTARLQLSMRPLWCLSMLLFLTLTAFAVFAFWGTFITHLDDTDTYFYNNSAFRNGDKQRIVIMREDKGIMTEEDAAVLAALPYVERVERFGIIRDVAVAYRENLDYEYVHTLNGSAETGYSTSTTVRFLSESFFLQSIPYSADGFLKDGRLPEGFYECVSADPDLTVGDTVTVFFQDKKNWRQEERVRAELTVVGTTESGSGLYFSDGIAAAFTTELAGKASYLCFPNPDIPEAEDGNLPLFRCTAFRLAAFPSPEISCSGPTFGNNQEWWADTDREFFSLTLDAENPFVHSHTTLLKYFEVSPETFEKMVPRVFGNQMSLTITAYAHTDQVIDAAQRAGYFAASPYRLGATVKNVNLAEERMNTLTVCLIAAAVVLLLEVLLLRALFQAETKSFRLLSNVGLTKKPAVRSLWLQTLLFAVLGQLLAAGGIAIACAAGSERILFVVRYLPPHFIALLSLLHFAQAGIGCAWAARDMRRAVFPFAAGKSDLDTAETEA